MKERNSGLLSFLYTTSVGRGLLSILVSPAVSKLAGRAMNTRLSALAVPGFIRSHDMDTAEFEKTKFSSYNDFFTRRLKAGSRPFEADEESIISPCDARLTVYPIMKGSRFWIKNGQYTLKSLLRDEELAKRYEGGLLWQFRLSVDDYHRYIYPVSGTRSDERMIHGVFHTVQPVALENCPVYKENTRKYCLIRTKKLGTVLMMEVGAMMVGRITNHETDAGAVECGTEKGYFEFGGSTIILLTQKKTVAPRQDIVYHSIGGSEARIRQGEKVAVIYPQHRKKKKKGNS